MAPSSSSLLLRHLSSKPHYFHHHRRRYLSPLVKHFSLSSPTPTPIPSDPPKPTSLSARLSFVFDKIDELEKDRSEKDQALQRIRAWRESKKLNQPPTSDDPKISNNVVNENLGLGFSGDADKLNGGELGSLEGNVVVREEKKEKREIELAHPWPEWVELMERLVQQNYFDHRREDENKMIEGLGEVDVDVSKFKEEEEGFDFTRDWKSVHNAMVNFGKDRFDIFRSLSKQDIQTLVGYGCPSADKKVVFSSKLLRKHAYLDEGDVCSSCSLRDTCERAYLVTDREDEARTIDVMRVLLTYGFDPINRSVENKSVLKQKSVKTIVRKLLHEVVRLSAVPIDPNLPPPVIKKRPPKVKQPPPPPKRRVGRDDIEMKKGDWLCPKCNFMNFAKNAVCLQCDAKRPKRQLLPGEWECPQCDFLNYRRNMTCFNCEHKRPPDGYLENETQGRQGRPTTRLERVPDREQVSNAWNFDFDDDESDGADVAAFEYADPHAMNEDRHLDSPPDGNFGRPQEEHRVGRASRFQEKEHSRPAQTKQAAGFNDFDDEDDDIDSYELDNQNRKRGVETSPVRFSDVESEGYSESEGDDDSAGFSGRSSKSYPKSSKPLYQGALSHSGDDDDDLDLDSDEDLPVHPKWKSSHVADSGPRGRPLRGPSKAKGLDSDEDDRLVFGSDDDVGEGFTHRRHRGHNRDSDQIGYRQGGNIKEGFISRQGRENQRDSGVRGSGRGDASNRNSRHSESRVRRDIYFVKGNDFGNDSGRSSKGSRSNQRGSNQRGGSFDDERGQQKMSGRRNFNESRQRGAGNGGRQRFNESDNWSDRGDDRPLRQRRNVR